MASTLNPRGGILSQAVPASEVMHTYCILRPGQVRGVPWLAPVMLALRDLDDYRDAERMRKKTEACLAGIVTRAEGSGGLPLGAKSTDPKTGNTLERMYPGMIEYLKPGEDIKFNAPSAAGGYREYLMAELQGVGAGVDVPYELLSGDLSNVNYSSYRAGMLGFRNAIEAFRWLTLIPMYCRPAWRRFIDTLVLIGKLPEANYGVQWTAPKFESVDPLKDAMAELKKIRTGTLTLTEAIAQNGYDPEKQLLEIQRVNALLDEYEIILDCDPRNVNDKGVEQPTSGGEAAPATPAVKSPAQLRRALRAGFEHEDLQVVKTRGVPMPDEITHHAEARMPRELRPRLSPPARERTIRASRWSDSLRWHSRRPRPATTTGRSTRSGTRASRCLGSTGARARNTT